MIGEPFYLVIFVRWNPCTLKAICQRTACRFLIQLANETASLAYGSGKLKGRVLRTQAGCKEVP